MVGRTYESLELCGRLATYAQKDELATPLFDALDTRLAELRRARGEGSALPRGGGAAARGRPRGEPRGPRGLGPARRRGALPERGRGR